MKRQKEYGYQLILSLKFAIFSGKDPFYRARGTVFYRRRLIHLFWSVFFFVEVGGGGGGCCGVVVFKNGLPVVDSIFFNTITTHHHIELIFIVFCKRERTSSCCLHCHRVEFVSRNRSSVEI